MKANEAPEKIYLQENTTTDCYGEFWPEWFEARLKDTDVEYTRTDALVKNVCEWLKTNYTEFLDSSRLGINIDKLVKDLKNDFKTE